MSRAKFPDIQRPDFRSDKSQCRKAHCRSHAPDLPVLAFPDRNLQPRSRDVLAEPNWDVAPGEFWLNVKCVDFSRLGTLTAQVDSRPQSAERFRIGIPLDLYQVGFWMIVCRFREPVSGLGIIRQEEQPFRIGVEPANRIH